MNRTDFASGCAELGIRLTKPQLENFERFEDRLYEQNLVMNLTRVPREECYVRHFLDSLLVASLIPESAKVLDIGTGPGFPAFALAVVRPDISVTALDSSGKMTSFLKQVQLPNLSVVTDRAETWAVYEKFHFVTGRALAPLAHQLELSVRSCRMEGIIVPMRTPAEEDSFLAPYLETIGLQLVEVVYKTLPILEIPRAFPIYRKVTATQPKYPRSWAEIKRIPL